MKRLRVITAALATLLISGFTLSLSAPAFASPPSELASIQVGSIPVGAAISPDESLVYVTNSSIPGTVSVINMNSQALVTTITVGDRAYGVTFTPDGTTAYVVNRDSNDVSVIDVATSSVISTISVGSTPYGITSSLDGSKMYVANAVSDSVSVISTSTNTVIATIGSLPSQPVWITTNPVSGEIYVTSMGGYITKIVGTSVSGSSLNISDAYSSSVSPDGSTIYVTKLTNPTEIAVVNATTWALVPPTINLGFYSFRTTFSPGGNVAFVADSNGNQLSLLDVATGSFVASGYPLALTGTDPNFVAVTSDCTKAVVVMANYPSMSFVNGFANIISTGLPVCNLPAPTPDPSLAATGGSMSSYLIGSVVAGAMTLVGLGFGLLLLKRRTAL